MQGQGWPLTYAFAMAPRRGAKADFYTSLPFPLSVDWPATTLRLLPSQPQNKACVAGDVAWLRAWHAADSAAGAVRARVLEAFRAHLDYSHNPRGVASALLREAATRCRDEPRSWVRGFSL